MHPSRTKTVQISTHPILHPLSISFSIMALLLSFSHLTNFNYFHITTFTTYIQYNMLISQVILHILTWESQSIWINYLTNFNPTNKHSHCTLLSVDWNAITRIPFNQLAFIGSTHIFIAFFLIYHILFHFHLPISQSNSLIFSFILQNQLKREYCIVEFRRL